MSQPKHFEELAANAFDFLEKASSQLEKEPKYSVINFFTGIELLLKARLLCEHWTLIYADPSGANQGGFTKGNFKSVAIDTALQRLKAVVGAKISTRATEVFDELRRHRNQLMHFYHADYGESPSAEALANVAAEQCRAWSYMYSLLTKEFRNEFKAFEDRIEALQKSISKTRSFLAFRYEDLKPSIEKGKERGTQFSECWFCKYEASPCKEVAAPLFECSCLVCHHKHSVLIHPCECGGTAEIEELGEGKCAKCGNEFDLDGLVDHYSESDDSQIHCSECEGPSVVSWGDQWLLPKLPDPVFPC